MTQFYLIVRQPKEPPTPQKPIKQTKTKTIDLWVPVLLYLCYFDKLTMVN